MQMAGGARGRASHRAHSGRQFGQGQLTQPPSFLLFWLRECARRRPVSRGAGKRGRSRRRSSPRGGRRHKLMFSQAGTSLCGRGSFNRQRSGDGKKEKVRIMKETGVCAMDALDAHRHLTMHVHAPAPAHMHTHVHTHAHTCTCSCRGAGEVRSEKGERETGGWTPQGWDTYSFSITIPALTTTSGP